MPRTDVHGYAEGGVDFEREGIPTMIIDGRDSTAEAPESYDVLIVGAGPAGIALALELDGSGLRIGLLESGGEDFDPDIQALYDGEVSGHDAVDLAAIRLRYLGGTSNHWGGRCLPMDRVDFARPPLSGETGWPISYEAMLPYWERAHPYFEVGQFVYDPVATGTVGADAPLLMDRSEILETAVIRQSATYFAERYRADLNESENIHLCLHTTVTEIEMTEDGEVTALRTKDLAGPERRFTARIVVLATGAVENARQVLALNAATGRRLGEAGGLLGRCYMDHPSGGAAFLWLTNPLPAQPHWTLPEDGNGVPIRLYWRLRDEVLMREGLQNGHFEIIPFNEDADPRIAEANRGWTALRSIAKWTLGRDQTNFSLSESYCRAINSADVLAADALRLIDRTPDVERLLLRYEIEQRPDRASYVSLSEARDALGQRRADLRWEPGAADRESLLRSIELIGQAAGQEGLGRIEFEDHFDQPYFSTVTAWHQTGTTRMAERPEDGVVDPDGRLHGAANLYIAGGSVMPTAGRANPTLTIVALSIRLADHLKERMLT